MWPTIARARRCLTGEPLPGETADIELVPTPRLEDAEAILHARRVGRDGEHRIRAGLLVENEAGLERLLATGWTESWRAPRLIRGEPLRWQPEAIWGQFNHALG